MPTNTPLGDVTVCMRHDPLVAEQGWTKTTSGGAVRPVALKPPNVFGLHDLVGNVAEWTADPPDASGLRALRGGSWYHNAEHVRASAELRAPPDQRLAWFSVPASPDKLSLFQLRFVATSHQYALLQFDAKFDASEDSNVHQSAIGNRPVSWYLMDSLKSVTDVSAEFEHQTAL